MRVYIILLQYIRIYGVLGKHTRAHQTITLRRRAYYDDDNIRALHPPPPCSRKLGKSQRTFFSPLPPTRRARVRTERQRVPIRRAVAYTVHSSSHARRGSCAGIDQKSTRDGRAVGRDEGPLFLARTELSQHTHTHTHDVLY